jgi:CBS domain-containing protein
MLTLRDLMTPAPVTIGPSASLRDAVELLTAVGVHALPVIDGERVLGIVTAQSIIAFESATPGVPTARDVADVWEDEAPDELELPPAAYFTELWDDAGGDVSERFRASETPEWDVLAEHSVDEAMIFDPPQLATSVTAEACAEHMRATRSHGVLVVDDGKLRGIVTTMDITRAFAARAALEDAPDAGGTELRGTSDSGSADR